MAVLRAEHIGYAASKQFQIHDMSIAAQQGERIAIIGPNGSGKSTMLRLMARLLAPQDGQITLDDQSLKRMKGGDIAKKLAMLPQLHEERLDMSVRDLARFGRHPHQRWFAGTSNEDREVIGWALGVTNMTHLADRQLLSLSGGERQRAWIAMSLAQLPEVLLLDEPTTFLDIAHQFEVLELLNRLNREMNMTIITVLHDLNQAARYADRLIVMKGGQMYGQGAPQHILTDQMFADVFRIQVRVEVEDGLPYIRLLQGLRTSVVQ